MRKDILVFIILGVCSSVLYGCLSNEQKDEKVARQYCGSCHLFPAPSMLSKATWEKHVMPEMSFRMGVDYFMLQTLSAEDQPEVMKTLPGKSMVSVEEWEAIKRYYQLNAPDTLPASTQHIADTLNGFAAEVFSVTSFPLNTFAAFDSAKQKVYVSSRSNRLYRLSDRFVKEDSFSLTSPASQIVFTGPDQVTLLLMGIMDPNDQPKGSLVNLRLSDHRITTLIDSLKRPVYFEQADLDADGLQDFIVCAFGNYSGGLLAFKNNGDGTFKRIVLLNVPGARKVIVQDFDNNGMKDIIALMSQGDEKIVLFLNHGNFEFRVNNLLTFPPVYGSSFFELEDFNRDGKMDILYTNGDNADYSMVLKPYHGVRVYLNNGNNEFSESYFYNMHGASEAVARDFDQDGDLDIGAISFFPDFKEHPEQGFIYFENRGSTFTPSITKHGDRGRWLTMEAADVDRDGDDDLLLSALDFNNGIPGDLLARWKAEPAEILLLRNTLHK